MGNEKKEFVQAEFLPVTKVDSPIKKEQPRRKRKANRTFQQAVDLVKLRRDKLYNQPVTGENLDGEIVDLTGKIEDNRPIKLIPVKQEPIPTDVPSNVQALSKMIEGGSLRKKKPKKEPESTEFTHEKVNRHIGGVHITGYAHDATQPQLGEQANKEDLHKMAEIAQKILKKPKSSS
jgi:hypothetical protein